jgi:hypothetical protein
MFRVLVVLEEILRLAELTRPNSTILPIRKIRFSKEIVDLIVRIINKAKTPSTLTKLLQTLLETHGEKTKQRNIIDYFIYAIYTVLADTNNTRDRISSWVPFLRILRETYPGLISHMYKDPKDEVQRFYNIELYSKWQITIKMPIHKRIAKEKLRKTYDINEMLDHLYDLFQHIGKDLVNVSFKSITKGWQKTIVKFSNKLKEMIKHKGDFYLPKSRSRSKDIAPNLEEIKKYKTNFSNISEPKNEEDAKTISSNEIIINNPLEDYKNKYAEKLQKITDDYEWSLQEKEIGYDTRLAEISDEYDLIINKFNDSVKTYRRLLLFD